MNIRDFEGEPQESSRCDEPVAHVQAVQTGKPALHRTIVVVDVEGFGDRRRNNTHQLVVRAGLYRALHQAFDRAGLSWEDCDHEDRGDAVFLLAPAEVPKAVVVDVLPHTLAAAVAEHNRAHQPEAQFRLRMALHAGEVSYDEHGTTASAVNLTFRLSEAQPCKKALAESSGVLVLITSQWFFDEVVRHSQVTDPATFRPARVTVKETSTIGWVSRPDHPYPADPTQLTGLSGGWQAIGMTPHQLPAAPSSFAGRAEGLAMLSAALDSTIEDRGVGAISVIGGAGGIGKTWLALRWAHERVDRFPDGELFVDLRGFSSDGPPLSTGAAVRGFLDAFGVEPAAIPVDLHAQAALYRTLIAGRRMLVVLDNAVNTAQVIPLLPGSDKCTVLVTSRNRLTGLVTNHSARHLTLGALDYTDARSLLTSRLGAHRIAAETSAVDELLRLCGGFPLALSIIAGRVQAEPLVPLAAVVDELREMGLEALDDTDPSTSLPTLFSWSYRALTSEQAEVFGLLGIAPGPDIDLSAVSSLTGLPQVRVAKVLRGLGQASLVDRNTQGRYRMHDLIRQFAADRAFHDITDVQRSAALRRAVDFYLHTAHAGERLLMPHGIPYELPVPAPDSYPQPLTGDTAIEWFDSEHPCLLAAQRTASAHGWHQAVWQLARVLATFHYRRGHLHDDLTVAQAGLAAAERLADPVARTIANRALGRALTELGRHDEALKHLRCALNVAEDTRDLLAQAHIHQSLAWIRDEQADGPQTLAHATRALSLFQELDDPVGMAFALNNLGWYLARLGDYEAALENCEVALAMHRLHRNHHGEAYTQDSLGYIAYHSGRHTEAVHHYEEALALRRRLGDTYETSNTLDALGHPYAELGLQDHARRAWQESLALYRAQRRNDSAERVQRQLDKLNERIGNL